jgi:hypothetical protein
MEEEPSRPTLPWSVKLLGVVVLLVAAGLVFAWLSAVLRTGFALAGYVVVAVISYYFGKAAGRASARR